MTLRLHGRWIFLINSQRKKKIKWKIFFLFARHCFVTFHLKLSESWVEWQQILIDRDARASKRGRKFSNKRGKSEKTIFLTLALAIADYVMFSKESREKKREILSTNWHWGCWGKKWIKVTNFLCLPPTHSHSTHPSVSRLIVNWLASTTYFMWCLSLSLSHPLACVCILAHILQVIFYWFFPSFCLYIVCIPLTHPPTTTTTTTVVFPTLLAHSFTFIRVKDEIERRR